MLSFQMGEIKVCVPCYEANNVDKPDTHKHDPYGYGMVFFDKFTADYFSQKRYVFYLIVNVCSHIITW